MDPTDPLDHEIAPPGSVHREFLTMLWVVIWAITNAALAAMFIFPISALLRLIIDLSFDWGGQGSPKSGSAVLTDDLLVTSITFMGWFLIAALVNHVIWAWGFRWIRRSTYMLISCAVDCSPVVIGLIYPFLSNAAARGNAIG